jgi:hypothetical protein
LQKRVYHNHKKNYPAIKCNPFSAQFTLYQVVTDKEKERTKQVAPLHPALFW